VAALTVFALVALPSLGSAAEFKHGGKVAVVQGDTLRDDLYICGGKVDIDGVVLGDVVACGGNINVTGTVTGSLVSAGGSTVVAGTVGRSARCFGGDIKITGTVGEDAVAGCGRLLLAQGAHVGRDLLGGAGALDVDGDVRRNLFAGGGTLTLTGNVAGNVRATIERARLLENAHIGGDLVYTSDRSVVQSPGATVGGRIEQRIPEGRPKIGLVGRMFVFFVRWERLFIGLLAIGLLLVLPFPAFSRRVLDVLGGSPGASAGVGVLMAVGIPFVAITMAVLGVLVGGWWLGAGVLVLFLLSLNLGVAVTGAFLGQRILQRPGHDVQLWLSLLAGLAILTLVVRIPILGVFVAMVAAVFGIGAVAVAARRAGPAAAAG
jgi:hypothetical protein